MTKPDEQMLFYDSTPMLTTRPNNLQIYNENCETLVTIDLTSGKITYGENYKVDKASKIFWESLSSFHTLNTQADTILREIRRILCCEEGQNIHEAAKRAMNSVAKLKEAEKLVDEISKVLDKPDKTRLSAPPGIMDDAPDGYFN